MNNPEYNSNKTVEVIIIMIIINLIINSTEF